MLLLLRLSSETLIVTIFLLLLLLLLLRLLRLLRPSFFFYATGDKTDDMEGFLKEITQKGFLRKASLVKDFDYSNNPNNEIDELLVESSILDSPAKGEEICNYI